MPDTDISHAVEERFQALEARVAALEGHPEEVVEESDEEYLPEGME